MDNMQKEGLHLNSHTKMTYFAVLSTINLYNKPWRCTTHLWFFMLKVSWFLCSHV